MKKLAGGLDVERLKVVFKLRSDGDGWPPADSERVWAIRISADSARLATVPFFVRGYALGDVVRFVTDNDGIHWVQEAVGLSDNCTIRIIPSGAGDGRLAEVRKAVLDAFAPFGVVGEGIARLGMLAVNVPGNADVAAVKRLLVEGREGGRWDYEEGCVTEAWRSAA